MPRLRKFALAALVLAPLLTLIWVWLRPQPSVYFTDGMALRQAAGEATARTVLWAPPELLAAAMNEDADSFDPCFSADGRTVIFARGRPKDNAELFAMRRESAGWSAPAPLAAINSDADELGPELSRDGNALFFYSDRPGGRGGYDVWVSVRTDGGGWGAPRNAPAVNSPYHEFDPALSPGADQLYFSSNRPVASERDDPAAWRATLRRDLNTKDFDIFVANAAPGDAGDGPRFDAVAAVPALNSGAAEGQVAVAPRGDFVYFSSDRAGGLGGFDLYRSRVLHGQIEAPENLGAPINSADDEMDPTLWVEGFGLAFSSDRAGAGGEGEGAFALFRSLTHEVKAVEEPHWIWSLFERFKWLILAALAGLVLAWWLLQRYFGEDGTLMQRCVAGSVVVHLVLLFLFAIWKLAEQVIEIRSNPQMLVKVNSDNLAEEKLALQIRESVATLPEVRLKSNPTFTSPPVPQTDLPDKPDLPPAHEIEPASADAGFRVPADDAPRPPQENDSAPDPAELPAVANAAIPLEAIDLELPDFQLETGEAGAPQPDEPLPPATDTSPAIVQRPAPADPSEASTPQPVFKAAAKAAPAKAGEASSAMATPADRGEVAPPSAEVPNVDANLAIGSLEPSDLGELAFELRVAPAGPVEQPSEPEAGRPSPQSLAEKKESAPAAPAAAPRVAASASSPAAHGAAQLSREALEAGRQASPGPAPKRDAPEAPVSLAIDGLPLGEAIVLEAPIEIDDPYLLRSPEMRKLLIEELGGSDETERAVRLSLDWFTRHQEPDGRWSINRFGGRSGHDVASTSLALLCYMGWRATHTHDTPHRETVRKGMRWLLDHVDDKGDARGMGGDMYDQGIAAIALAEAFALTKDQEVGAALGRAVGFIVAAQGKHGGWRYQPGEGSGDTSVVGWQVLALRSARQAGAEGPEAAFDGARRWLDHVGGGPHGGLYGYQNRQPKPAMVAEGMFCRQLLGDPRDHPRMLESANYINTAPPKPNAVNYYYWYYGALAMFQHQGPLWEQWNSSLEPILTKSQIQKGDDAGSWKPEGQHGNDAGRAVVTAMATLSLEVYFRYLPMYGGKRG